MQKTNLELLKFSKPYSFLKDKYFIAGVISFGFLLIKYFVPDLISNEVVYLIPSRRIMDISFLHQDWTWGPTSGVKDTAILFNLLMAPIWLFFKNPINVALTGRVIVWIFLIYSMIKLTKSLEIEWWIFIAVFWILVFIRQATVAGEWVFGGVEQKCFSYGFVFLSLSSLLKKRNVLAAVFCGIAILFHVIVGLWSFFALLGAQIILRKEFEFRQIIHFSFASLLLGLPILFISSGYLVTGLNLNELSKVSKMYSILVLFRNPHHLDPYYFLNLTKGIGVIVIYVITILCLIKTVNKQKALFVIAFINCLMMISLFGVISRGINFYWFLNFYPFRVGFLFLWLLFLLSFLSYLFSKLKNSAKKLKHFNMYIVSMLVMVVISMGLFRTFHSVINGAPFIKEVCYFPSIWHEYFNGKESSIENMAKWIKQNTNQNSIFITPPCVEKFWLYGERAQVVNFKAAPANFRILEWYERLRKLNGGKEFNTVDFDVCGELSVNYPSLKLSELILLKKEYNANYFLVNEERKDLEEYLVFSNGDYFLYDLNKSKGRID